VVLTAAAAGRWRWRAPELDRHASVLAIGESIVADEPRCPTDLVETACRQMHAGVRARCEGLLHASHSGESAACCGAGRKMGSAGLGDCGWMRAVSHDKRLVGTDRKMPHSNRERPARKKASPSRNRANRASGIAKSAVGKRS
jgi:hypothetical protein